jgi:spore maturation protein CgeB
MNIDILKKHNNIPGAKKVFFVPINTLMVDYYDAFMNNGFELYSFNFAGNWKPRMYDKYKAAIEQKFLKACEDIKPDWVFLLMDAPMISGNVVASAKKLIPNAVFTNWTGDVRPGLKPGVEEIGKVVDITLIVGTGQIEMYEQHGLNKVEYLQTGYNVQQFSRLSEDERKKLRNKLKHDIVFCANNAGPYPGAPLRKEVVSKLSKTFGNRFAVYGGGWNNFKVSARGRIPYNDQQRVYNGSKIVISVNNFNNVDMYFSARQLNGMAAGTLTLSCYIPGLETIFENKKDLVWFKTADECIELAKYYLEHEDEALQIGINGNKEVAKNHTKFARIKEMSKRLGFLK